MKEPEIRQALELLNEGDYKNIDPIGKPETFTETEKVGRDGLLGKYVDKLIGKKTVSKTETRFVGGIEARKLRYVKIVKAAENQFRLEKTRERRRKT